MRFGGILAGLLALALVAWAAKPGGGSSPGGVIYYGDGSILPDGTGQQTVPGAVGQPSHTLHGGDRWFVHVVQDGAPNPDGSGHSTRIVATRDDGGSDVTLVPSSATWRATSQSGVWAVWGKDDSFVSYIAMVWYGSGAFDADSYVLRADITWDSGTGEPSVVGDPEAVVEVPGVLDVRGGGADCRILQCDWEPGAGRLVYWLYGTSISTSELRVYTVSTGDDVHLASSATDPWWAPDGSRIAYAKPAGTSGAGIRTIDPDASGSDSSLLADGGKWRYHTPRWSPDSAHLCFSKVSSSSASIARVAATGGSQATVKTGQQPIAWR